jgi:tRNA(Ile)-lysidine synthase
LEQKVANFIKAERLFAGNGRILLAVSGGADSTALLHIMDSLKNEGLLPLEVCCAHINHQLRGAESQRDKEFVVSWCRKLKIPVFTKEVDVRRCAREHRLSIETAARKLRIDALIEFARQQNCACIATAHQENDNAETVLQRLIRGTGFRGLCGIWPVREFTEGVRFIRPLLCVDRRQILDYLNERGLKWRQDKTNFDTHYRRNYIRHKLLPAVQKNCDDVIERLSELTAKARGFYRLVCTTADAVWAGTATAEKESISLNLNILQKLHPEVKIEIMRRALSHLNAGEQDFTENHYRKILKLSAGAKLQLPGEVETHRQGGEIIFSSRQPRQKAPALLSGVNLILPGTTEFAGVLIKAEAFDFDRAKFNEFKVKKSNTVEWFDLDSIRPPLVVRFRKPGDKFRPLGLKAGKKIGKFLTDEKIPQRSRRKLFIISDKEKIIWLCPVRPGEQTKITSQTKTVLQLRIYPPVA